MPDLTEAERKAADDLAALRARSTPKAPVSASFRARMASATVDPDEMLSEKGPEVHDERDFIIFRP